MSAQLELDRLSKVFGLDGASGLDALKTGLSKAELLESTGQVIGADAYCRDAATAVETAKRLVGGAR